MQRIKLLFSLAVAFLLALSCSPGGSEDGDDSGSEGLSLPNGILRVVTGDVQGGVTITIRDSAGESYIQSTGSDGSYTFPSSVLKTGAYTVTPDKQGVTFVPEDISVTYDGLGESNVDFASLFNLPDSVENNFNMTTGSRNYDLVSLPSGNAAFVSTGARVRILDPDQYASTGQIDFTGISSGVHGTPTYMAVPKDMATDPMLYIVVELNNGTIRLYKYKVGDGISNSFQAYFELPAGSSPTDVAVSPDGRVVYVAREGDNIIELIDASTMTPGVPDRIVIDSPISIDVSDEKLYVVSQPVNTGLDLSGSITTIPTLFHNQTNVIGVEGFKPTRVMLSHDQENYYLLTQADSDNKASVLCYTAAFDTRRQGDSIWTSDSNNIPTNFALMPNDSALYVTIDTLSVNGRLAIINLDDGNDQFDFMQEMSLLSGFGDTPNAVALTIRLVPVQIAGWVSHDGNGSTLAGSMISFR